ncbi:hypothetical protein IJG14_02750 [bacterium]|nr:hypothetical protein [bacterium]
MRIEKVCNLIFCYIGDVSLKNGHINDYGFELYEELLKGDVGTLFTGFTTVCDYDMTDIEGMFRIDKDEYIPEYQELTSMAHEYDTNIIMQLVHIGSYTFGEPKTVYAASVVENPVSKVIPVEISKEGIK